MTNENNNQKVHWAAETYDQSMGFVSRYGEDLMEWLNPQEGESIVDFGCGTGDLAAIIASKGAKVLGVDISSEMVERARLKYPHLNFECADGTKWTAKTPHDAVFSNAALHWMKDAEGAIRSMTGSLRAGGRLVAELGGYGNIDKIMEAVKATLKRRGREDAIVMPWYFPTVGQYCALLEKAGMEVRTAILFDRPTRLEGGVQGMKGWLEMFGTAMFPNAGMEEVDDWIDEVVERIKLNLYNGEIWTADYRRLRIVALKK
jgi:trans-aconitate methyltransferase